MTSTSAGSTSAGQGAEALRRALRRGAVVVLLVSVLAGAGLAVLAGAVDGARGVSGAIVGIGVAAGFFLVTLVVGAVTAGRDPLLLAGAMLGSWLAKAIVVIIVLVLVRDAEMAQPQWVFAGVVVGIVASLTVQARLLLTARIAYVDAPSTPTAESSTSGSDTHDK